MVLASARCALFFTLAAIAALAQPVRAQEASPSAGEIPAVLVPASESVFLFALEASGVQIYTCEAKEEDPSAFAWTLQGPDAELFNQRGEMVGSHFAGPTWQGHDGSAVVAAVAERADAPNPGAIPWLLLEAKEHEGSGAFSTVTHIQRLNTAGGMAPAEGCDAAHEGDETREPYTATYAFFYPAAPAA